jgi:hypothetical protein
MAAPPVVYEWLERLENHLAAGGLPDLDAFVRENLPDAPPELVEEFRRKAQVVLRFHARFDAAVLAPTPGPAGDETDAPAAKIAPGEEPIPGYRLEVEIARGGYGRVWRATAPDGRAVAVKVVDPGELNSRTELRAFRLLCAIRHPNLIAYREAVMVGRHLIIVMDLADRTAADRLAEVKKAGGAGIPRDELMGYMTAAAAALDYLNGGGPDRKPIQHRDVKPGNLLLVGRELRVADFGLARTLERTVSTHTGSHTPLYAAPEFFKDRVSSRSDQYSLAVTYCELRGGRLPFAGSRERVLHGHLHDEPDLTMLPPAERPVVRRALAKTPHHRWRSCTEFVAALRDGPDPATVKRELDADVSNVTLRRLYLAVRTPAQAEADRTASLRPGPLRALLPALGRWLVVLPLVTAVWWWRPQDLPQPEVVRWLEWGSAGVLGVGILVGYRQIRGILRLRERLRGMVAEIGPLPPLPIATPPDEIRARFLGPDRDVSGLTAGGAAPARTP